MITSFSKEKAIAELTELAERLNLKDFEIKQVELEPDGLIPLRTTDTGELRFLLITEE